MKAMRLLLLLVLVMAPTRAAWADRITLKNGNEIRGVIMDHDENSYTLQVEGGMSGGLKRSAP